MLYIINSLMDIERKLETNYCRNPFHNPNKDNYNFEGKIYTMIGMVNIGHKKYENITTDISSRMWN